jgi:hypothetical protein
VERRPVHRSLHGLALDNRLNDGVPFGSRVVKESASPSSSESRTAYLDGKPGFAVGKKKLTKKERDSLFWASAVVKGMPARVVEREAMSLALARYLGQEPVAAEGLVTRVAREAPETLIRAVRYSGLVLNPHSPRRAELDQAASESEAVAELCRVLDLFALAHRDRVAAVEAQKARLAELSVFDFLIYASLYAFEALVPRDFKVKALAYAVEGLISSSPGMHSAICSRGSSRAPALVSEAD